MFRTHIRPLCIAAIIITTVILTVLAVNISVDPLSLCSSRIGYTKSSAVAENMSVGLNSDRIDNSVDERMVKRIYIENYIQNTTANTMALGSSRAAMISTDMLGPDDSLINLSVTGAELKEIVALYGLARSNGYIPENLIISLDMWWLNANYSGKRFDMSLTDAYDAYVTNILGYSESGVNPESVEGRFKGETVDLISSIRSFMRSGRDVRNEMLSIHYFQDSIKYLLFEKDLAVAPVSPSTKYTDYTMIRYDGSYSYPPSFRDADTSEVYDRALEAISISILGCEDYYELDSELCGLLCDFLKSVQEDGVNIKLIMLPVHPAVEFHMMCYDKYSTALSAEEFYLKTAEKYDIPIAGSFSSDKLGFGEEGFYDALHVKDSYVADVISLLEGDVK